MQKKVSIHPNLPDSMTEVVRWVWSLCDEVGVSYAFKSESYPVAVVTETCLIFSSYSFTMAATVS